MRPNNPNKRLRGRNRSKNSNPLARSYESNGPDVKIRGSALQVADKYAQLARDAQSAGDRVMAENYFQHAEHYYRIVAAAYEQQQPRDRRDDQQHDRNARIDDRSEQPVINGYDGVDDDDGVRRTLGHSNGGDHQGDEDGDDDGPHVDHRRETVVNGAHHANGTHHEAAEEQPGADEQGTAVASDEEQPKPKRRARATRSRTRSRKADAGEGQPQASSETEAAESTN
jgi:hypothetical protein